MGFQGFMCTKVVALRYYFSLLTNRSIFVQKGLNCLFILQQNDIIANVFSGKRTDFTVCLVSWDCLKDRFYCVFAYPFAYAFPLQSFAIELLFLQLKSLQDIERFIGEKKY